ncbi:hypothetical protein [Texcoconibacillus texcoconensis]|uniref:Cytochrome-c oxidase n=1 Tax=Texcoconibacillus texcoconensis TaxID=1095777 RepID=A0A840QQF2_9BACI|nr:hypothetical protein [Texcoconibacillus texcoconensis]MBB5173568.1 hypothetical protein [Texcoconibacillus texcoconensis]
MRNRTRLLLRVSAIFAVIGSMIGSHMAGSGTSYELRPLHAHILVVGWLSLFGFSIFYRIFQIPTDSKLSLVHVWSAIIGTVGLSLGMYLHNVIDHPTLNLFLLFFYIIGGTVLLISFIVFLIMSFVFSDSLKE